MNDQTQDERAIRNRRNAAKSTGPQSAGGKARAARNATKHGLSGREPDAFGEPSRIKAGSQAELAYTRFVQAEDAARAVLQDIARFLDSPLPASETEELEAVNKAALELQRLERYRRARLIQWTKACQAEQVDVLGSGAPVRPGSS